MTGILREERFEDLNVAIQIATKGLQKKIWTAMPGIILAVDLAKMTCKVQIAVMAQQRYTDGSFSWIQIQPLLDCPLVFPGGGGFTLTFPVAVGDEALVVFASRCIDAWWQSGGYKNIQMELRLHDLSDGFALVGPRSQPRVLPNVSANSVQLRSDDGTVYVEATPTTINVVATAAVNVHAPAINLGNGGALKKLLTETAGAVYNAHTHNAPGGGGVTSGPSAAMGNPEETSVVKAE